MEVEKDFNIRGIAVDVITYEWEEDDIINKTPIILNKISKRNGGFTLFMKGATEDIEWYFSRGLTNILIMKGPKAPYIRIEHEDGTYWVDLPYNQEVLEFLKEFREEEEL